MTPTLTAARLDSTTRFRKLPSERIRKTVPAIGTAAAHPGNGVFVFIKNNDSAIAAARARTAQAITKPTSTDTVAFGSTVAFRRDDGRVQKYRIVGEDEADPKAGSISFVSPVAKILMGKTVGDAVGLSGQDLEIVAIS